MPTLFCLTTEIYFNLEFDINFELFRLKVLIESNMSEVIVYNLKLKYCL